LELTIHVWRIPAGCPANACVTAGATAAVSCNGTAVAGGAVLQFCAARGNARPSRPCGPCPWAAAVAVISELRRKGLSVVDVAVRVPQVHYAG
jgi:hypothetical protein